MILLALHGILTGRSDVTWPERLQAYAHKRAPEIAVLTDQYDAGPFPRANWFFGNPRMARAMAKRILAFRNEGDHDAVVLVGHSNGCDIVRRVAALLAKQGVTVQALIMVAPPISPRLAALGLGEHVASGLLQKVVCYYTPRDTVLAPPLSWNPITWALAAIRWPYGNMGRVGIANAITVVRGEPTPADVFNRIFPDYWHTTYFDEFHSHSTFNLILTDARRNS